MLEFLQWLEMTPYAAWVRESVYGWAIVLTIHAYGNAIVVGVIFIVALRMLGIFQNITYTSLNKLLIPLIWVGVVTQVFSGFSLFLTKPPKYATDTMFLSKMGFLVVGVVVTLYLQKALKREALIWAQAGHTSSRGLQLASVAAFAWAGILILGRVTAYVGQLYDVGG